MLPEIAEPGIAARAALVNAGHPKVWYRMPSVGVHGNRRASGDDGVQRCRCCMRGRESASGKLGDMLNGAAFTVCMLAL